MVIIIDFRLQKWLHERTSLLRYTYIACIVEVKSTLTYGTDRSYG
jgi:hypothetical protein